MNIFFKKELHLELFLLIGCKRKPLRDEVLFYFFNVDFRKIQDTEMVYT